MRQCTNFFPTPPLVSPKFPHVPLEVGGWRLGSKERRCWANCPCSQFPRFPTYVITIHQRHRQTDRQTDRRHAISIPHCAHSASRGKNDAQTKIRWLETQHAVTLERFVLGCWFSPVDQFPAFHAIASRPPRRAMPSVKCQELNHTLSS